MYFKLIFLNNAHIRKDIEQLIFSINSTYSLNGTLCWACIKPGSNPRSKRLENNICFESKGSPMVRELGSQQLDFHMNISVIFVPK